MQKLLAVSEKGAFFIKNLSLFAANKINLRLAISFQDAIDMVTKDEYSIIAIETSLLNNLNMISTIRRLTLAPIIACIENDYFIGKAEALRYGADDYCIANGDFSDFLLSVKALLRRYLEYSSHNKKALTVISISDLSVCLNTRRVFVGGVDINIRRRDFDILMYFINNKNRILTYDQIYSRIWGTEYERDSNNVLWCQMHRLNSRITPPSSKVNYIDNVRGVGYRLNPHLLEKSSDEKYVCGREDMKMLVIGYNREEFTVMYPAIHVKVTFNRTMQPIYEYEKGLWEDDYSLVVINGDSPDYLYSIRLVRNIAFMPIIVLTDCYDRVRKAETIETGADAYLPISDIYQDSRETAKALIRRYIEYSIPDLPMSSIVTFDDIYMSLENRKVFIENQEVILSRKEFDILYHIIKYKGEILSYEQLYNLVWGKDYEFNSYKALMSLVHRLKEKIRIRKDSSEYILNIREIGYRLNINTERCPDI